MQFPERDHSVFVGTREGAWGCKKVEGQSGNCIFLFTSSGLALPVFNVAPFFGSSDTIPWAFFCLSPPLNLCSEGKREKMIKSSWFYVKFKYSDKVSQYIFFSLGKPASPCSLMLTGLVVTVGGEGAREC